MEEGIEGPNPSGRLSARSGRRPNNGNVKTNNPGLVTWSCSDIRYRNKDPEKPTPVIQPMAELPEDEPKAKNASKEKTMVKPVKKVAPKGKPNVTFACSDIRYLKNSVDNSLQSIVPMPVGKPKVEDKPRVP